MAVNHKAKVTFAFTNGYFLTADAKQRTLTPRGLTATNYTGDSIIYEMIAVAILAGSIFVVSIILLRKWK